jgi:hypothetical protein
MHPSLKIFDKVETPKFKKKRIDLVEVDDCFKIVWK